MEWFGGMYLSTKTSFPSQFPWVSRMQRCEEEKQLFALDGPPKLLTIIKLCHPTYEYTPHFTEFNIVDYIEVLVHVQHYRSVMQTA